MKIENLIEQVIGKYKSATDGYMPKELWKLSSSQIKKHISAIKNDMKKFLPTSVDYQDLKKKLEKFQNALNNATRKDETK